MREATLTVESHVFGEGLRDQCFVALFNKVSDSPGIVVGIAAGEAYIGRIEEGKQTTHFHNFRDLLPLPLRGIQARGIVAGGLEQYHSSLWRLAKPGQKPGDVQFLLLVIPVGITSKLLEASLLKNLDVIAVRGV